MFQARRRARYARADIRLSLLGLRGREISKLQLDHYKISYKKVWEITIQTNKLKISTSNNLFFPQVEIFVINTAKFFLFLHQPPKAQTR